MVAMEKGANRPPSPWLWLVTCSGRADLARVRIEGLCRRSIGGLAGFGLAARDGVLEPIALAIHLQDMDVVREAVEQRGRHLGIAEDARPLTEGQVGGDDDRGALVEPADEVEQQLTAGLSER